MEERERVVTTRTDATDVPPAAAPPAYDAPGYRRGTAVSDRAVVYRTSADYTVRRLIDLIFGIIIGLIALRILLLLLNAREGNALVAGILNLSQIFVAPFEGILRWDALSARGSVLDVAAIVAIVGWVVVWWLVKAVLNVFRRDPYAS